MSDASRAAWTSMAAVLLMFATGCAPRGLDSVPQGVVLLLVIPDRGNTLGSGSGFLVDSSGTIVTNHHVVSLVVGQPGRVLVIDDQRARRLRQSLSVPGLTESQIYTIAMKDAPEAVVRWADERQDLAILTMHEPPATRPLPLAPGALVHEGDRVWSFGFPGINRAMGAASLVTLDRRPGEITSRHTEGHNNRELFATNLLTLNGMSGGPAVNACGEVIGVNFGGYTRVSTRDQGQVTNIESIRAFVQVDTLLPALRAGKVSVTTATSRCATAGSLVTTTRDPLMVGGLATALLLACAGLALGVTARGRAVVRGAAESVSRRLSRTDPRRQHGSHHGRGGSGSAGRASAQVSGAVLHGLSGEFAGVDLEIGQEPIAIGRDPRSSHLVFPADASGVSKRHCAVWFDAVAGEVLIEDLASSNGTFLADGRRLEAGVPHRLSPGDQFSLGQGGARFEVRG